MYTLKEQAIVLAYVSVATLLAVSLSVATHAPLFVAFAIGALFGTISVHVAIDRILDRRERR